MRQKIGVGLGVFSKIRTFVVGCRRYRERRRFQPCQTWVGVALVCSCATVGVGACSTAKPLTPGPAHGHIDPVVLEMEPMKVMQVRTGDVKEIRSFDAEQLFEEAGEQIERELWAEAADTYHTLLLEFPHSKNVQPARFNRALAMKHAGRLAEAIEAFSDFVTRYREHPDGKDAAFHLGDALGRAGDWRAAAEVFAEILSRTDLSADDRVEATARRGKAQLEQGTPEAAEATFQHAVYLGKKFEGEERLATSHYLAFAQYHLAQVTHQAFETAPCLAAGGANEQRPR